VRRARRDPRARRERRARDAEAGLALHRGQHGLGKHGRVPRREDGAEEHRAQRRQGAGGTRGRHRRWMGGKREARPGLVIYGFLDLF
jgi:hypothetical protein